MSANPEPLSKEADGAQLPVERSNPDASETRSSSEVDVKVEDKANSNGPPTQPLPVAAITDAPDGGGVAWAQVAASWVLFFNTWGLLNTFGVYQEYYESGQLFTTSSSNISWIGSVQSFLLLFVGTVSGPLFDAGYLKALLITGSFMIVFGHMMLSLVHEFWEALLAQAFCIGIGAGLLFIPSVAILSQYFRRRLSTAIGLSVSGSSIGGVIYPIMFQRLVREVGFPWAVRIIGFMALVMLIVPCVIMKMRVKPTQRRALLDLVAFKEPPYVSFVLSGLLGYLGLLIPFFYISYFAAARGYASDDLSFYVLPIANAASTFGRTIPSIIADKTGPVNMLIPAAVVSAIVALCLISVHNFAGVVLCAVFYGFATGTYISLPPAIFVHLTPPDKKYLIGTRLGMGMPILGIGILIGTPVAGAILGENNYFTGIWLLSGCALAASAVGFVLVRFFIVGFKGKVKV